MKTEVNADTVTNEEILALRAQADQEIKRLCNLALLAPGGLGAKHEYREARARCAEILNALRRTP